MRFEIPASLFKGELKAMTRKCWRYHRWYTHFTLSADQSGILLVMDDRCIKILTPVYEVGSCSFDTDKFLALLESYAPSELLNISCSKEEVMINGLRFGSSDFKCSPITQDQERDLLDKDISLKPKRKPSAKKSVYESGRLIVTECTGEPGRVEDDDISGNREVLICPLCKSVGYFKKLEIFNLETDKQSFRYSQTRTWTPSRQANENVVITGYEDKRLCPSCLDKRHKQTEQPSITVQTQPDLFDL